MQNGDEYGNRTEVHYACWRSSGFGFVGKWYPCQGEDPSSTPWTLDILRLVSN